MARRRKSLKRFLRMVISELLASRIFSDKASIKLKYRFLMKRKLNLKEPKTFNEKLNWIKLYYRKPIMTTMVDKYEVKKLVSNLIGEEYVIPSIAIYDKWDDIEFDKLPKADCVIVAVGHNEFRSMSMMRLKALFKDELSDEEKVLIDVKSLYRMDELKASGMRFWRL